MLPSDSNPDETNTTSDKQRTRRTTQRNQWIVIVVLSFAVAYVIFEQVNAQYTANVATDTAKDLGEAINEQCRADPSVRREIGNERCDKAAEVIRESTIILSPRNGKDGKDGKVGKTGRGIAATAVVDGRLFVTYTDGVREDKGVIAVDGQDGRGIVNAMIRDSQLVLTYTDSTSETVGRIVGRDGTNGRGIDDVVVSADYRVIVTYSDGTVDDVGALPPGPTGPSGPTGPTGLPGRGVQTVDFNMSECTASIHYTDGTTETKSMNGCEPTSPTTTTTKPATSMLSVPPS